MKVTDLVSLCISGLEDVLPTRLVSSACSGQGDNKNNCSFDVAPQRQSRGKAEEMLRVSGNGSCQKVGLN